LDGKISLGNFLTKWVKYPRLQRTDSRGSKELKAASELHVVDLWFDDRVKKN